MIYLYNNELEKISIIGKDDLREFTTTEELNSQWIVEISYPFSLHKKEAEYVGFKDNNEFKLYKITHTSRSDDFIDINGVHIFFHDLKGKVIRDVRPNNKTAIQVATEILTDTDWEAFSTSKGLNSTNFYYVSKLDAFYDLLEKWQCEFRLETYFDDDKFIKKIYLEDHISKDYGRWFEYGDKLLTVVAEENHSNVFTAFIGRGKGEETGEGYGRKINFDSIHWSISNGDPVNKPIGQDYVEIKEATKLYGYPDGSPSIGFVDFSNEEDKENLLKLTYEHALENSRPKLQLKATAVDDNKVELGEVCAIIRPNLDIRYKTRIFKVKTDRLSDLQEFEFGDKIVISSSDRIRAEQKTKEKEFQEIESRLEEALKNVDIDFNNEDGYNYDLKAGNKYNLPAGYYSFNKPIDEDPTKVVYMGAGKVLIADEKGSDGNWKWKTAIDGTGIAGSEILTHSITANKLAADVGQSLDLSSNVSITQTVKSETQSYIDENKEQLKGADGNTPYVEDGYWFINGTNTGIKARGKDGIAGKDGKGITSTTITYGLSTTDTVEPTNYTSNVPTLVKGQYLWTKTVWKYTDNTTETGYTKAYIAKDGNSGTNGVAGKDGVGIKTTTIEYAQSSSGTVTPTSGWATTIPSVTQGNYLWTKTTWNYTDNTSETGYSVAHVGKDGAKGAPGTPGSDGKDGATPYIGANGNWWINGIDTGVEADVAPIREEFESYRKQTDKAIEDRVTKTVYNGLTTRVAQAEQKLKPASITQTVENNTTTLATKAEVQTTAENWTAKFSQVGGENLYEHSEDLLNRFSTYGGSQYASGYPKYVDVPEYDVNNAVQLRTIGFSGDADLKLYTNVALAQELESGEPYTMSFYIKNNRTDQYMEVRSNRWDGTERLEAGETKRMVFSGVGSSDTANAQIQLRARGIDYYIDCTVWHVKLERGWVATEYNTKLYTGITKIDRDGVTVGREGETIETNVGFDGLRINDGRKEIASFRGSGAVINDLQAQTISGNIVNVLSQSVTLNVGSGTGYFANVSEALNSIGNAKYLESDVVLEINIYGVHDGFVSISGFMGSGEVLINLRGRIHGGFRSFGNSCKVTLIGIGSNRVVKFAGTTIMSSADSGLIIRNIITDSENHSSGRGLVAQAGSNVTIRDCDLANNDRGVWVLEGSKVNTSDLKGNSANWPLLAEYGVIFAKGTIPQGGRNPYGLVYYIGTNTPTPSSYSPPATQRVTETLTFNHTDIYTYSVQYGARSTYYGKAAAQNRWDSTMTQMKGRISFGTSVYNFIAGRDSGTTPTVRLRLRRQNSTHGTSASVKPTPEWSGAPSFGGATRGNWTPWVTIPYTLFTSSGYTFSFYNGTTGSSYAIWDRAEIQITRTVTQ